MFTGPSEPAFLESLLLMRKDSWLRPGRSMSESESECSSSSSSSNLLRRKGEGVRRSVYECGC